MRHETVKVNRDTNTQYSVSVARWEIPVLEIIFGDGNVEPTGEFVGLDPTREYPQPSVELDRLVRTYGNDPQSGVSYAEAVYGRGGVGIRALMAAIVEEKAAERKAGKSAGASAPRAPVTDADVLLS